MTSVYVEDVESARDALREAGILATLRRTEPGTIAPVGGAVTGGAVTDMAVYAIGLTKPQRVRGDAASGALRTYSRQFYFAIAGNTDFEPAFGDQLLFEGRWWGLSDVRPLRPDGLVTILYEATAAS